MKTIHVMGAIVAAAAIAGCSIDAKPLTGRQASSSTDATTARPGDEDSSKTFKGKMTEAEEAFWEAVLDGDDDARAAAVKKLKADVKKDPKNGYSAFLAGSNPFHATASASLRSLVDGTEPPAATLKVDDASANLLESAVGTLKDPLYRGFAATLLGTTKRFSDPDEGERLFAISGKNNVPADRISRVTFALVQSDAKTALDLLFDVMDHCLDTTVDRDDPPLDDFIAKANDGGLEHRECYSGHLAPHGTEGALFIGGDLSAVNGKQALAKRMYETGAKSKSYATWKLRDLNERRISGAASAKSETLMAAVQCGTCHQR